MTRLKSIGLAVAIGLLVGGAGSRLALQSPASAQTTMQMGSSMPGMAMSKDDTAMMASMTRMQAAMNTMHMTGNTDHDFLVMMIPHHQAAVDMAIVELKDGKNPKVRALAKSIIATQQAEIREMTAWVHGH
jgi:uncharacterized protein (DUF305 family)